MAPVHPRAGNGSEYSRFEVLPRFALNVLHAYRCGIGGIAHLFCEMAQDKQYSLEHEALRTNCCHPNVNAVEMLRTFSSCNMPLQVYFSLTEKASEVC